MYEILDFRMSFPSVEESNNDIKTVFEELQVWEEK